MDELKSVNLSKFVSEAVSYICEAKLRSADIQAAVQVIDVNNFYLHQYISKNLPMSPCVICRPCALARYILFADFSISSFWLQNEACSLLWFDSSLGCVGLDRAVAHIFIFVLLVIMLLHGFVVPL
jgi:hypothetical protein